ncbi:MAG: phosphatidate cytidylyltransferase [Bacteroidales bacterium]|nr:phosphatidate cytidylyltransferase [Bacteroidales bacterium]
MKNLILRTCTGIAFVALVVAAVLSGDIILLNVFMVFACIGLYEYVKLLDTKNIRISWWFYVTALVTYFLLAYMRSVKLLDVHVMLIILTLMACMLLLEVFRRQYEPIVTAAYSVLGVVWIAIPMSLVNILAYDYGKWTLLVMFILLWLSDTLAYCVGSLLGRHKLCERISPKKTWEGSIGSALLTMTAAGFMPLIIPQLSLTVWQTVGMAGVIIVSGTMGDLFESLLKRSLNVKDSGNILPGHGGILDRFDSMLAAVPFVLLYLVIINLL